MEKMIKLLKQNARLSNEQLGAMLGCTAGEAAARIADLEKKGTPIGPMDMLIAGHAKAEGLILVTNNTREFCRVEGLRLENWAEQS